MPKTAGSYEPPLCPPLAPAKFVMLVVDISANPLVFYNLDAVKALGTLELGGGEANSGNI